MKLTPTPKYFQVADIASIVETSLVQFLDENSEDITPNQRKELHAAQIGDIVTLNDFVGHTVRLTRIK